MYITQEADYAARIVLCLAKRQQRMDARRISEEVSVTLRFSLKILGKLSAAGIVQSFKGNRGGYELARPAAEITLQEVLSAVDGPYSLSRCLQDGQNCNRSLAGSCVFRHTLSRLSRVMNEELAQVNFQRLMEEEADGCVG